MHLGFRTSTHPEEADARLGGAPRAHAHTHAHTPPPCLSPASASTSASPGQCGASRQPPGGDPGRCGAQRGARRRGRHGGAAAGRGVAAGRLRACLLQPGEGPAVRRHRQPAGPHGRGHGRQQRHREDDGAGTGAPRSARGAGLPEPGARRGSRLRPPPGISSCGRSREPFNLLLRVNHISPFLLTHLLLPRLKSCAPSRVVVVSSAAHRRGRLDFTRLDRPVVGWRQELRAYADSKLANVLYARELATQLEGTGITCYAAHPGPVNSELFLRHIPGWLRPLLRPLAWLVLRAPRGGAQTPLYCALQEGIEPLSGRYFANCHVEEVPPAARDDRAAHRLWEASKRLAGLGHGEDTESDEDPQPEDPGTPSSLKNPHPKEPMASEPYPSPRGSPDLSKVTRRIPVKAEPKPQAS
ncbi:dehydrogenase/reductase SDR family member 13 isoform X1 [Vicugna pacos]|uniref:Dehydrogenase/reductase SDR family member 13 isoform X1 n=1 Tax=Vicugna pacos TaxID=30538 RepID=A0ABM5BFC3_VICPA